MSIFSRRYIQQLIHENRKFLSDAQTKQIVDKLNARKIFNLDTVWEVLILNLLSKHGLIEHEKLLGQSNPDIFYENHNLSIEFVGDITTVSDADQQKNNDTGYFQSEVERIARKNGIPSLAGFHFIFSKRKSGERNDEKVRISLPQKNQISDFVSKHVKPILLKISGKPNQVYNELIEYGDSSVTIQYDPKNPFFGWNHPSYRVATSLTNNPVYNGLEKKSKQLKKASYGGYKGIFLCDGDCEIITAEMVGGPYNLRNIVNNFLQHNSSIDFVFVFYVKEERKDILSNCSIKKLNYEVYYKDGASELVNKLMHCLHSAISHLPEPLMTAKNALNYYSKGNKYDVNFYGGYKMIDGKPRISARSLLRFISGEISADKFYKDYPELSRYIKQCLKEGKRLTSANILHNVGQDDDWIEFSFDEFDSAISDYKK